MTIVPSNALRLEETKHPFERQNTLCNAPPRQVREGAGDLRRDPREEPEGRQPDGAPLQGVLPLRAREAAGGHRVRRGRTDPQDRAGPPPGGEVAEGVLRFDEEKRAPLSPARFGFC